MSIQNNTIFIIISYFIYINNICLTDSLEYAIIYTILFFSYLFSVLLFNNSKRKTLYIIRGFPGCGKSTTIENNFNKKDCYIIDNFDLKCSNKINLYVSKDNNLMSVLDAMLSNINTLVISGFFPNSLSLQSIRHLAFKFDYHIEYYSFDIPSDDNFVKYLLDNSSIRQYTNNYILKNYHKYGELEEHTNEVFFENFNQCEGDSIPYPVKTKDELDYELDVHRESES